MRLAILAILAAAVAGMPSLIARDEGAPANATDPATMDGAPMVNGTMPLANGTTPVVTGPAPVTNGTAPATDSPAAQGCKAVCTTVEAQAQVCLARAASSACQCESPFLALSKQCVDCTYALDKSKYVDVNTYNTLVNVCAASGLANQSQFDTTPAPSGQTAVTYAPAKAASSGAKSVAGLALGSLVVTGATALLWL